MLEIRECQSRSRRMQASFHRNPWPGVAWSCACLLMASLVMQSCKAFKSLPELLLAHPQAWPDYVRGNGQYKWVLNHRALSNGLTFLGSHERLRVALDRLVKGQNLTIATVGGSITAGQGCLDAPSWPTYLMNYMQDTYGPRVQLQNGAIPGTLSGYMSVCLNVHIPKTSDIVFVEYTLNDLPTVQPPFQNNHRKQFERLLRKILNLPHKPAVVLVHTFSWGNPQSVPPAGTFWVTAEREFDEFAHYYHLPTLSLKTCCWELLKHNVDGFWTNITRNKDKTNLAKKAFSYDGIHPDGQSGARVVAELPMYLLSRVIHELKANPITEFDQAMVDRSIPEPMIHNNWESVQDKCFIGQLFTNVVTLNKGFDWVNEGAGKRSKWGMVSREPDSVIQITLDTRSAVKDAPQATTLTPASKPDQDQDQPTAIMVNLAYLRSYAGMGMAVVTCESGCACKPMMMDGHTTQRTSQLHILAIPVTQHEKCVIQVKVVKKSQTENAHKVKIAAVIVSEETGQDVLLNNAASVELVHDATFKSKGSQFDIRNDDSGVLGRLLLHLSNLVGAEPLPQTSPDEMEYDTALKSLGWSL